jgi:hypothetical protein
MFKKLLMTVLFLGLIAGIVAVVFKAKEKKRIADETAQEIEDELAELDPATRAAVIAKLGADALAETKHSGV